MAKNYVCHGAKIECQLCTKPEGKLMVTSNQVKVQDKFFATAKDKGKMNLIFQGNCKKSPYQSSPCAAVISPQEWQNTADLKVQDAPALLENSTIMCMYGGTPIKITDHLQVNQPQELQPVVAPVLAPTEEPMYTHLEWQDTEKNSINENNVYGEHVVFLQTQNILPGEQLTANVTANVTENEGDVVKDDQTKANYTGTVDSKGVLKIHLQNSAIPKAEGENAPIIEEMYWRDCEGNEVNSANEGEQVDLYIKVTNLEEGEELTIGIDNDEGQRVIYTGTVDAEGNIILKL